ncbi:hypothetical protein ACLOJK_026265 [Asimina triloba]
MELGELEILLAQVGHGTAGGLLAGIRVAHGSRHPRVHVAELHVQHRPDGVPQQVHGVAVVFGAVVEDLELDGREPRGFVHVEDVVGGGNSGVVGHPDGDGRQPCHVGREALRVGFQGGGAEFGVHGFGARLRDEGFAGCGSSGCHVPKDHGEDGRHHHHEGE